MFIKRNTGRAYLEEEILLMIVNVYFVAIKQKGYNLDIDRAIGLI